MKLARVLAAVVVLALLVAWGVTCALREPDLRPAGAPPDAGRSAPRPPRARRPAADEPPAAPAAETPTPATRPPSPAADPARRKEPDPTIPLRLRIIGADGRPAAGARICLYQSPDAPPDTADADEKGEATLRASSALVAVHAWSGEHAAALTLRVSRTEPAGPVDIYLRPGERIAGRVVDERGLAVSTAVVRLALPLDFSGRIVRLHHVGSAAATDCRAAISCRAQEDGTFAFPPLPHESDTRLVADAAGFAPFDADVASLPLERGALRVDMVGLVTVRGRVTGRRGAAVTDFRVRLAGRVLPALIDADGVFTATGAPRQSGWLVVLPGGGTGLGPSEVAVPATQTNEADLGEIRLGEAVPITGTIVWPDGRTVDGGLVEVTSRVFGEGKVEVSIGEGGSYRIPGTGDAQYFVRVSAAERTLDPAPAVAGVTKIRGFHSGRPARGGEVVRITLDAAPILVLHSVDADGRDVPFDGPVQIEGWPIGRGDKPPEPTVDGARLAVVPPGRAPWRLTVSDASHLPTRVEVFGGWPVVEQTIELKAPKPAK